MKKAAIVLILSALIVLPAAAQTVEGNGTWYSTTGKNLSASHAALPFGTRIRITNLDTGGSVIVTITSRIPEDPERLIDVSQAAARNIGMNDSGPTGVKVEVLTLGKALDEETPVSTEMQPLSESESQPPGVNIPPAQYQLSITIEGLGVIEKSGTLESGKETLVRVQAEPEAPPPAIAPVPPPPVRLPAVVIPRMPSAYDGKLYRVQVGSFSSIAAAVRARNLAINAGYNVYYERYKDLYRIVLIHVPSEDIPLIAKKLGNAGFRELWAREE
ncbi:MAG: SPOR domain-containing protein [Treponema sp.]|jgi:hypothetical protein|nr:SPOR domain-containing protein [Treponema sp.]